MASIKDLQDQMNKNSAAWHGASQAEKDRLHQENQKLQQQIDSMNGSTSSFNSSGVIDFTVACVPTGINIGVCMSPCGV